MAKIETIRTALAQISSCFPTFKKNDEITDIIFDELFSVSDDTVACAVRHLIVTESYPPKVADIVGAVRRSASEEANRTVKRDSEYTDYFNRSPTERAKIDEARNECLQVMAGLANGVPVEQLYPPDSEPVRLGRELAERLERWGNRDTTKPGKTTAISASDVARGLLQMDYKRAASGERDDGPNPNYDW